MLWVVVLDPTCSCEVSRFEKHFVGVGEGERFRYACAGISGGGGDVVGGGDGILKLLSSACVDGVGECGFRVTAKPDFGILK